MTNQTAQKVRLVKCPKCKNILPELADVPIYACGGCGAFLKAKRLINNKTKGGPHIDEANTIPENELDLSNDREAQSSSEAAISTERLIPPTEIENHGTEESSFGPEPEKAVGREHTADDDENVLASINPTAEVVPTNQPKESYEFPTVTSKQNGKQLEDVTQSAEFVQQDSAESSPPTENYDESSHSDVSCTGENDQLPFTIGNIANEEEENCGPSEDLTLKPRGGTNCTLEVSPSIKLLEDACKESPQITCYDDFGRECARDRNPSVIIPSSEEPSPTHGTNTDHDQHSSSSNSSLSVFRLSTDTNLEPPYGLPNKQPETIAHRSLHSISSVETIGNTNISPLDAPVPYLSYEGSVSSYDGIDDQAPFYLQGRPHQMRNFSSFERDLTMEGKKLNPYELPEYRGYGHPVRSQNTYPKPGHRCGPYARPNDYRSCNYGSTSTCGCNDLKQNRSFDIVNQVKYAEDKKMELLEMINELQDQINDIHVPMENVKGKLTNGCANRERRPPFHDPTLAAEAYHQDTNYARRKFHSRQCQISRMAFSAEAPFSRHQADPRTWHYSAELPPCQIQSSEGVYTYNTQMGCNCRRSGLLGPQNFSGSDSSLMSPDWKYDDICNRNNNVMKNLIKDRLHSGKKHVRPTVGGAPFVVCYHCKKLLQLPTDFIVFKNKKSHRLRCGYCSHVLRFSFENDNCMVPKTENTSGVVAPPPSEANTHSGGRSYAESRRIRIRETRKISTGGTSSMELDEERTVMPVVERQDKGMPSSSKLQKSKAASSMTLHKLMGYSSPSQVFFRGKSLGQKR